MAHVICINRCYAEGREFVPGEVLRVDGDQIPVHFRAAEDGEVAKQRVYHVLPKPKPKAETNTAHARAERGEAVSLSELNGEKSPAPGDDLL